MCHFNVGILTVFRWTCLGYTHFNNGSPHSFRACGLWIGVHLRKCWKFHLSMCFRTSVARIMSISCWSVFYFRVRASCSRHGVCPSVNICWRREESLWLNSFVAKNFQNTWCSCFLLVWMIIRLIPQSGACFGAKLKSMRRTLWQSGKSWHLCWRRWPFICRCPS